MKASDAFPSAYFRSEDSDFADGHCLILTVKDVRMEELPGMDGGSPETKACAYFTEDERKLVLNRTNWLTLEQIGGSDDSDDWRGSKVEIYVDPKVRMGAKLVKGLRVRTPGVIDDEMPF